MKEVTLDLTCTYDVKIPGIPMHILISMSRSSVFTVIQQTAKLTFRALPLYVTNLLKGGLMKHEEGRLKKNEVLF